MAGTHVPIVSDSCGAFTVDEGVEEVIALVVSSVSPSQVSQYGTDLLTISGNSFGSSTMAVSVTLYKVGDTLLETPNVCTLLSVEPGTIKCYTSSFDSPQDGEKYDVKVDVNSETQTLSDSIEMSLKTSSVVSISPAYVSPVLESELVVQLISDYAGSMTVSNFRAEIILVSEQTEGNWIWDGETFDFIWVPRAVESRKLYIKSVDADAKTITLKFRGAKAGEHVISIYSVDQ